VFTADRGDAALESFEYHNVSLPLDFTHDPESTSMFSKFSRQQIKDLAQRNYTWNSHHFAVAPTTFVEDNGLSSFWDVTATSAMPNGTHFVASIEAKDYPIFATQFHPEQPSSLWVDNYGVNHSWQAIQTMDVFGRFFVELARTNKNTYGSFEAT
jgi:gamma-glutamyl hydrolase